MQFSRLHTQSGQSRTAGLHIDLQTLYYEGANVAYSTASAATFGRALGFDATGGNQVHWVSVMRFGRLHTQSGQSRTAVLHTNLQELYYRGANNAYSTASAAGSDSRRFCTGWFTEQRSRRKINWRCCLDWTWCNGNCFKSWCTNIIFW